MNTEQKYNPLTGAFDLIRSEEIPNFFDETSTIADFETGKTYYYIGEAPIVYDYDLLPYPLPIPVQNFNFVNLSVHTATFISDSGNYTYTLEPQQALKDITILDVGSFWEIQPVEYIDNIYDLQRVTGKGAATTEAIIVRTNPDTYRTRYSIIGQQVQRDDLGYSLNYIDTGISKLVSANSKSWQLQIPDLTSNANSSSFTVGFRPNVSGTVAYLGDITTPNLQEVTDVDNVTTNNILVNSIFLFDAASAEYHNISNVDYSFVFTDAAAREVLRAELGRLTVGKTLTENAVIQLDNLTTSQGYQLPNKSGTFALLDDVVSVTASKGITKVGNDVRLGGTIVGNVTISSIESEGFFSIIRNDPVGYDVTQEITFGDGGSLRIGNRKISTADEAYFDLSGGFFRFYLFNAPTFAAIEGDASNPTQGFRLTGFGGDAFTGIGADYSTLVGTSLVPKKYVDDFVLDVVQEHFATSSVTVANATNVLYVNPNAILPILIITLAAAPIDGQELKISFGGAITAGQVVTALSIVGNTGHTVLAGSLITTANAGDGYILKYESANSFWRVF